MKIYGKKEALRRIGMFTRSGRMPHAVLLTGDEGAGKRVVADYIAMLMLCESGGAEPCGVCNECMRIEQHIHPDVVYPLRESKGGKYTAAEIVEFIADCGRLPNDSEYRICVFEQIDGMNISCQNALLKFIEEPQRFNRFIFTASDKSSILNTIISRVTEINIPLVTEEECVSALIDKGLTAEEAKRLSRMFSGNIGRCLNSREDESAAVLYETAERIAQAVLQNDEYACLAGFTAAKNRENLGAVLRYLSDIFGNAAAISAKGRVYGFLSPVSKEISRDMNLKKINNIYKTTGELLRALELNPNVQIFTAGCCAEIFEAMEKSGS